MAHIPQEIVDRIIDESASFGSKKDLSSLGLTSRAFVPRARSHLFRHLNIDTSSCPIKNVKGWKEFKAILLHSPDIANRVRRVVLGKFSFQAYTRKDQDLEISWPCPDCEDGQNGQHFSVDAMDRLRQRKASYVISALTLLPHLQQVHMDGQENGNLRDDWNKLPSLASKYRQGMFFLRSTITTLSIKAVQNLTTNFMGDLLQCSHLESLKLEDVYIGFGLHDTLDNSSYATIIEESRKSLPESGLTSLKSFGMISCASSSAISFKLKDLVDRVIRGASTSLQNLELVFPEENLDLGFSHVNLTDVDLTPLNRLKVFSTNGSNMRAFERLQPFLLQMIDSGAGKRLEVLEISGRTASTFSEPEMIETQRQNWRTLDELLDNQTFSNLREIRLLFEAALPDDWDGLFPRCTPKESVVQVKSWLPRVASKPEVRFTYVNMNSTDAALYAVV